MDFFGSSLRLRGLARDYNFHADGNAIAKEIKSVELFAPVRQKAVADLPEPR